MTDSMDAELLAQFGVLVRKAPFDASFRMELIDEMRRSSASPTEVFVGDEGRYVLAEHYRRVRTVDVSEATRAAVHAAIVALLPSLGVHFQEQLTTIEPIQFLRYEVGDHFVAHRDAEAHDERHNARRVSIVTYLNGHEDDAGADTGFGGGELLLMLFGDDPVRRNMGIPAAPVAGTMVAFRSDLLHEVRPVTFGSRFTLVTWAR